MATPSSLSTPEQNRTAVNPILAPQQLPLPSGPELRDQALSLLERTRAEYIALARRVADALSLSQDTFTADDVVAIVPVPAGMDGRVLGAVLTKYRYEKVETTGSTRPGRHANPIGVWRRKP